MSVPNSVAIIGGGAAGIFTAYKLMQSTDVQSIALFEQSSEIGGDAHTIPVDYKGETFYVDAGAQFFSETAQPSYWALLKEVGLLNEVITKPAGVQICYPDPSSSSFWIPNNIPELFLTTRNPLNKPAWISFGLFMLGAVALGKQLNTSNPNYSLTVDQWLGSLPIWSHHIDTIIKPFLYQFDTVAPSTLGQCSALYTITYLLQSFPTSVGSLIAGLFQVSNSRIGLQGNLKRILERTKSLATPEKQFNAYLGVRVLEVVPTPDAPQFGSPHGRWLVKSALAAPIAVDAVVFATQPHGAGVILRQAGEHNQELISLLESLSSHYSPLKISMQKGTSCYMPEGSGIFAPSKEAVNIISNVTRDMFTVWFGQLRDPLHDGSLLPVYKSWGNPDLHPSDCKDQFFSTTHNTLVPTPAFLSSRQELMKDWNGWNDFYFAGGWTNWYDSQESALRSAEAVVWKMEHPDGDGLPEVVAHLLAIFEVIMKYLINPVKKSLPHGNRARSELQSLVNELEQDLTSQ
jgi:hypothetical protein